MNLKVYFQFCKKNTPCCPYCMYSHMCQKILWENNLISFTQRFPTCFLQLEITNKFKN